MEDRETDVAEFSVWKGEKLYPTDREENNPAPCLMEIPLGLLET